LYLFLLFFCNNLLFPINPLFSTFLFLLALFNFSIALQKKVIARKVTSEEVECDRPSFLTNNNMISKQYTQGLGAGVHMAQPWFHSGISRQESVDLITKHGLVDG